VIRVLVQGDCHPAVVSYKSSIIDLVGGAMVIMSNLREQTLQSFHKDYKNFKKKYGEEDSF